MCHIPFPPHSISQLVLGALLGRMGAFQASHSKNLSFYEQGNENVGLPLSTYLPQHLGQGSGDEGGEDLQRADCVPKTFLGVPIWELNSWDIHHIWFPADFVLREKLFT